MKALLGLACGFVAMGALALAQTMPFGTEAVTVGTGAVLRGLDKHSGDVVDLPLSVGETIGFGRLQITLGECRYPTDNPSGNAYAWLVIREGGEDAPAFDGWMIASSPALNALDHPRYDVWVMRCTAS